MIPGSSVPTTVYTYYTVEENGPANSDIRIGRLKSEASWDYLADSTRGTTYYHYDAAGRVTASWGSATATTLHAYDAAGRRTHLRTFRSEPSAFTVLVLNDFGDVEDAIVSCAEIGDLTQWVYSTNPALGAVVSKVFPDGTSTDYSYNAAGQVQTRKWARTIAPGGPKVTTTCTWNNAGQLTGIGYNDGTPSVALSYDRSGRVRYRTDGTGVTRMDYRFDGSPLRETNVDSASDSAVAVAGGRHLRRAYDSSGRLWTMEAAWGEILPETAGTPVSSTLPPKVVFGYGAADRLISISSGGFTGAVTRTATQESFSVSPNTGLYYPPSVYSTVYSDAQGRPSSHAAGGTINVAGSPSLFSISTTQFGWNGDRLVSRTEAPDAMWNYTYDSRGQVRDAWKTVQNGGIAVTLNGTQSRYSYDDMGNRTSLGEGPGFARMTTWTPNGLNQYSSVNRPGTFDVTDRGRYREAARHLTVPETSILRHGLARLELSMSERLQITPDICHGKPVIRGTRVLVSTILGALAGGDPIESVLEDYPNITREDVRAALEFASRLSDYEESAYDAVA
jgi:YD repeat-containing protein